MKKIDIANIAFGNFKRRKARSILTVLGVVIGTSSVVTMLSLGIALDKSFTDSIDNQVDLITVNVSPGFDNETGKQKPLTDESIKEIETIPNIVVVSPQLNLSGKLVSGKYSTYSSIVGIDMTHAEKLGFTFEQGGMSDNKSSIRNINAIFGGEIPYQFTDPKANNNMMMGSVMIMGGSSSDEREPPPVDLMADTTRVKFTFDAGYGEPDSSGVVKTPPKLYNIVPTGILSGGYSEKSYRVYIDMEVAKALQKEQQSDNTNTGGLLTNNDKKPGDKSKVLEYSEFKVIANSIDDTLAITDAIKELGYQAYSSAEFINQMKESAQLIQLFLGGIGSISLLVAAIGITNTMIMSIFERTKEIGVMKVIGCQLKDIRTLFLMEAGIIGLFGGIAGVILSSGLSALLNGFSQNSEMGMMMGGGSALSVIPLWLVIIALAFSTLIGILSGYLPAKRAMKLSALEAMRT